MRKGYGWPGAVAEVAVLRSLGRVGVVGEGITPLTRDGPPPLQGLPYINESKGTPCLAHLHLHSCLTLVAQGSEGLLRPTLARIQGGYGTLILIPTPPHLTFDFVF